jgi:hypothetical protein
VFKTANATFVISALAGSLDAQNTNHSTMDHVAHIKMMADSQRRAEVAGRGQDVMPFSLAATTHIFTENVRGGIQQVVVKKPTDAVQVKMIRQHLQEIRYQFLKGDFSGPSHIHGQDMPGLSDLKASTPGQIAIDYKEVKGGAQLTYKTGEMSTVTALHKWFDAQLSDHGKDAMSGHTHHDGMKKQQQ